MYYPAMLRVGVIGLGIGKSHLRGYASHPDAQVVAIADLNPAALTAVGDEFGISNRYTSYQELLERERPDVVSVALPNFLHKPATIAALEAGAHVLCEKPMALNAFEAREMDAAARRLDRRIMINFSYRFKDQSWALKRQVDSGVIGDVYFARSVWHRRRGIPGFGGWFGQKQLSGGGALIDLGVHRLDLALWLMGYPRPTYVLGAAYNPIAAARAVAEQRQFDVDELAVGCIRFENGATLILEASWAANIAEKELMETRLYGTRAGLVQRNRNETYEYEAELFTEQSGCQFDMKLHDSMPLPAAIQPAASAAVGDARSRAASGTSRDLGTDAPYVTPGSAVPGGAPGPVAEPPITLGAFCANPPAPATSAMYHFVDSIVRGRPHTATAAEGIIVMDILDAIYESARLGQPVLIRGDATPATAAR